MRPELWGAGYNSSNPDDWGPAITAALVAAQAQGVDVQLSGITYGIATTVTWPQVAPGAFLPSLKGLRGGSTLQKLEDVTLVDFVGTSERQLYWCGIHDVLFDGNSTVGWTTPLLVNNFTENCHFADCAWKNNYGPAITARCAWDTVYMNPDIEYCGATDGVNPAVYLYSDSGDGSAATNNQWFVNPRIEDWSTGALWAIAADPSDALGLIKIVGTGKFELSGSSVPFWGPAVKLVSVGYYSQDAVQFTSGGTPASGQSTPADVFMYATDCSIVNLGRIQINFSSTSSTDYRSFFHFDGSTVGTNNNIQYTDIEVLPGDYPSGVPPTSLFLWTGGTYNGNYNVARGSFGYFGSWWGESSGGPTLDSGNPISLVSGFPLGWTLADASVIATANQSVLMTAGGTTVTLPTPSAGALVAIQAGNEISATSNITVEGSGTSTIYGVGLDGASSFVLGTPGSAVVLQCDGLNWWIVAGQQDTGWVALTLTGGWTAISGTYTPAYRLQGDTVMLRGGVESGSGYITTLPAAARPTEQCAFTVPVPAVGGTACILVFASGPIQPLTPGNGQALDVVRFPID